MIGGFLATGIGSIPYTDIKAGIELIITTFQKLPFWPQFPKLSWYENMYIQFSEHIPNIVFDNERIYIDTNARLSNEIEKFYESVINNKFESFAITEKFAKGLYILDDYKDLLHQSIALKGQITGPISFGLQVTDENKKPIIYNSFYQDLVIKNLYMQAKWQESFLKKYNENVMIFLDEPYLASYGSAYVSLSRNEIVTQINEVLKGLDGLKGVHCCANTDWSILFETSVDVISLDAYEFADSLLLYTEQLKNFFNKGGIIAWGIVPTDSAKLKNETVKSLIERLSKIFDGLFMKGIEPVIVNKQSLITPACGMGSRTVEETEKVFKLTKEISATLSYKIMH